MFKHRHYGRIVMIWAMLAGIPIIWMDLGGWPGKILSYAQLMVMTGGMLMSMRHRTAGLCEKCIEHMPLDGAEQAQKRQGALKTMHVLWQGRGQNMVWFLIGVVLLATAGAFAPAGVLRHMADSVMMLPLVALFIGYHVHERLQPWCPFCHWGNGGEEEPSPEITPSSPVLA